MKARSAAGAKLRGQVRGNCSSPGRGDGRMGGRVSRAGEMVVELRSVTPAGGWASPDWRRPGALLRAAPGFIPSCLRHLSVESRSPGRNPGVPCQT